MASDSPMAGTTCRDPFLGGPQLTQVCAASSLTAFLTIVNAMIEVHPKIAEPCGRVKPTLDPLPVYDFVVIGVKAASGAAGAAVAARLSEVPEWKILLLEAGPDEPAGMEVPANYAVYIGSELDWKFTTSNESHVCLARNGSCSWPRGKNLGGTTGHHGMTYHRGTPADYEKWADMGNVGWNWTDVLPFFLKSENNQEIDRVGLKHHSIGGPMTVERFPWQPPITEYILRAAEETGYGTTEDLVGDKITGFTVTQHMNKNGIRQTSASAFLRPVRHRTNLDIALNAMATKIVIQDKRARAVEYIMGGENRTARVNQEVVVSGGTVSSPQLLLLSGIGPASELEEIGIPSVIDLPGVGKNLNNHVGWGMAFEVSDPQHVTDDNADVSQYLANQTGPLSSTGLAQVTGIVASQYTAPDDPDLQIFFDGYQKACLHDRVVENRTEPGIDYVVYMMAVYLHAKSRGAITLQSSDPLVHPRIFSNELSNSSDLDAVIAGMNVIKKIANSSAMQEAGLRLAMEPVDECKDEEFLSDDYFRCAIPWHATSVNHPAGTCKMGPASDPMAVVDPELRVHGIEGLRVADASIMPMIVSGNPHASITMVGERAADFIKKSHDIE